MDDKISLKIKKLLELASSSFEAEAKSALLKAQELMTSNNISYNDLEGTSLHKEKKAITKEINFNKSRIGFWEKQIVAIVSENFRCFSYITLDRINKRTIMSIIGMEDEIDIAKESIEFAVLSLNNSWKKYYENRKIKLGKTSSRQETEMIKNDYMMNFIEGLRKSFEEQIEQKSLVIIKNEKVKDEVNNLKLGRAASRTKMIRGDSHAQQAGMSDGQSVYSKGNLLS